ncbi:hypothetical protein AVDCRST_MAG84-1569 [uncultured Microcoleus sp.]|uniref:Uncharacterized protein n=1 Tax=uncultured Microcoleus sp. TaxID=259945 RepID=A0A6J4L7T6_9CYAN|nr:hypothetical protein AVDCRST_MAG84-1569 [uncultured Microcoleus sp.]
MRLELFNYLTIIQSCSLASRTIAPTDLTQYGCKPPIAVALSNHGLDKSCSPQSAPLESI